MTASAFQRAAANMLRSDPTIAPKPPAVVVEAPILTESRWFANGAVYVNRESGKRYRPHSQGEQSFVYSDTPRRALVRGGEGSGKSVAGIVKALERVRRGMSGIMGCVDPHTLIQGVPAAEYGGGIVRTLYGPQVASKAFWKGRTDLYRVRTAEGREVTVTLDHRFLTPHGWCRLRDLSVGALIAACDSVDGAPLSQRATDCSARYSAGFRPYGGLSSLGEGGSLNIKPLLDTTEYPSGVVGENGRLPGRLCTESCSLLDDGPLLAYEEGSCVEDGGTLAFAPALTYQRQLSPITPTHTALLSDLVECPFCAVDDGVRSISQAICTGLHDKYPVAGKWSSQPFLSDIAPEVALVGQKLTVEPSETPPFESCRDISDYTTFWVEVQQITWSHFGDFYDLTVPVGAHYEAAGLLHHNSPDFVHFRKSLWKEFQRWCPRNALVPKHRYKLELDWQPQQPFELVFVDAGFGQGTILCGGFDSPGSWEGPNVNWGMFDEARQHPRPTMVKVLDGRCRIPGPSGEPPQWWITTTPRKSPLPGGPEDMEHHWLFVMFGPWTKTDEVDPYADFKREASDTVLILADNASNLAEGYVEQRRQSLTAKEARVLADAEWEDDDDAKRFLESMLWWDACREELPPLGPREPLVIALDAAVGRQNQASDCFGLVGITNHPTARAVRAEARRLAVRLVHVWQARAGEVIDYEGTERDPGPKRVLWRLIDEYNVKCVTFDQYQLVSLMQETERVKKVWCDPFSQQGDRLVADKQLLDLIVQKRFAFDANMPGAADLRAHIDHADRKVDEDGSRFRLVKGRGKIDLAVCASMGTAKALELNL